MRMLPGLAVRWFKYALSSQYRLRPEIKSLSKGVAV